MSSHSSITPTQYCAVTNCTRSTEQYYKLNNKQIMLAHTCYPAIGTQQSISKDDTLCCYHYTILCSYAIDIVNKLGSDKLSFNQQWNGNTGASSYNSANNNINDNDSLLYEPLSSTTTTSNSPYHSYQQHDMIDNNTWPIAIDGTQLACDDNNDIDNNSTTPPANMTSQLQRALARHTLLYSKLDRSMISFGWIVVVLFVMIFSCYAILDIM